MGGVLPDELLRERLQHVADTYEQSAYEEYAHLGRQEVEWVLERFPSRVKAVASPALDTCPEKTLGLLLDAAAVVHQERSAQGWSVRTEDAMPEIKSWILGAKPNGDEVSERRKLLAVSLEEWFAANKNPLVAVQAAELVLSIRHETNSSTPGEPMTMTLHFGVVAQQQLSKIAGLWQKVLPILSRALPSQGSKVAGIFHEWVHPNQPGKGTPPEYEEESRRYARQMMGDLLDAYAGKWTFHHHCHNYAEKLGLSDKIQIDPTAEVLYPPRDFGDWEEEEARRAAAAEKLAFSLKDKAPGSVAGILTRIEEQAREANITYPTWGRHVCWRIAEATDNPAVWIHALRESGAPAHLLEAFFAKSAAQLPLGDEIEKLLKSDRLDCQALGVSLVLRHSVAGTPLWEQATPVFKNYTGIIDGCVLRKEITNSNLKALLDHEDHEVTGVVAASMCGIRGDAQIPADLFEAWQLAIVRHVDDHKEHVLECVFPKHPQIAYEWIAWRLEGNKDGARGFHFGLRYEQVLSAAVRALTREQRLDLIGKLTRTSSVRLLVRCLVGGDVELFRHLLSREELEGVRLDPLGIECDDTLIPQSVVQEFGIPWQGMAIAAMNGGFSEMDIFSATQGSGFSWSGPMSSMYASRLIPFEKLLQHEDYRLRKVGQIGVGYFSKLRDEQLAAEKRAAVRGS